MRQASYPAGWDEERVRRVLEHYDAQSDDEAVAEDEAAYEATTHTAMEVDARVFRSDVLACSTSSCVTVPYLNRASTILRICSCAFAFSRAMRMRSSAVRIVM